MHLQVSVAAAQVAIQMLLTDELLAAQAAPPEALCLCFLGSLLPPEPVCCSGEGAVLRQRCRRCEELQAQRWQQSSWCDGRQAGAQWQRQLTSIWLADITSCKTRRTSRLAFLSQCMPFPAAAA